MKIVEKAMDAVTVLCLQGELNAATDTSVRAQILQLLHEGKKFLVLDLAEVTFLASGGLRTLHVVATQADSLDGHIVLARLSQRVRDILELTGFLPHFEVCPTVEEALAALRSRT